MLSEEVMKRFSSGTLALHCPTKEIYDKLMIELEKHNYYWCEGGEKPTLVQVWGDEKENTCISWGESGLEYDNLEYYRKIGYKINKCQSESQQDLKTLRSLFKKYQVCIAGNLEETIEKAAKKEMDNIMISEETWEKFRDGEVVFKCTTQELWDKLMVELKKRGYDISIAKDGYKNYGEEGYGIDNGSGELEWCNTGYYKSEYPNLEVVDVTACDSSNYPQPPQELIGILRALATCELIEKTYSLKLNLDELYDKREEYLEKWASEFEVYL